MSKSEIAILVENIGKRYRIGSKQKRADTLAGAALNVLRSPAQNLRRLRRLTRLESQADDIFEALQDISFNVSKGEVVGIIGRNGAGKSTLLKILSRITYPSSGRITLHGRVSSLLEVGTGFHPELTGRENVYLNGTILGMRKKEIDHKFDEIVDFSGISEFVDTPVKRYSSGMIVRLAFSVAAHLEPEILLVDEVLAVGDTEFQKRCLGKMESVASEGRTILFVSHDMQAVQKLCERTILLDKGRVVLDDNTEAAIGTYLEAVSSVAFVGPATFNDTMTLHRITVSQNSSEIYEAGDCACSTEISIAYDLLRPVRDLLLGFDIFSENGSHLYRSYDLQRAGLGDRGAGQYESTYVLPPKLLKPGHYYIEFLAAQHRQNWLSRGAISIKLRMTESGALDITYPGLINDPGAWTVSGP